MTVFYVLPTRTAAARLDERMPLSLFGTAALSTSFHLSLSVGGSRAAMVATRLLSVVASGQRPLDTVGHRGGSVRKGFERSQVMDTAFWLTDRYGPRLGVALRSSREAAEWAIVASLKYLGSGQPCSKERFPAWPRLVARRLSRDDDRAAR